MNPQSRELFKKGVYYFNRKDFYEAHEYFEEMWTNYKLDDKLFIQALIQLAVAYFHITNSNKNGALGLFKKSISKLDSYLEVSNEIVNINDVIKSAHKSYEKVIEIDDINLFDWSLAPKLKIREIFIK